MDLNKLCIHCLEYIDNIEGINVCPRCGKEITTASEVQHQLKSQTILAGKYLVGDVLGEGGFGITYVGFDLNLEMRVAIKEFYPNGYATRESNATTMLTVYTGKNKEYVEKWRDNFIKEARSLAKCSHLSGIVGVKDFFQENNTAYIVMEYLEGMTLKEYAKSMGGKIPAELLVSSMKPIIQSLQEVHKKDLIHRDISPDNIMLLPGGAMKLLDFGAARDYSETGERSLSVMLKPGYAPEEQYRTKGKQGPWSDVYALSATMYRCITGVTPPESMERLRKDELQKPSELGIKIHPTIEAALLKGMAVFAEDRYQSMAELLTGLNDADEAWNGQTIGEQNLTENVTAQNESFAIKKTEIKEKVKSIFVKLQELVQVIKNNPKVSGIAIAVVLCLICVGLIVSRITNKESDNSTVENDTMIADVQVPESEEVAAEEKSELEMLLEKAKQTAESGDYVMALTYYEQAKTLDNQNEGIYIAEADLYLLQDNPLEAMWVLREGIEITDSEVLVERREYVKENTRKSVEHSRDRDNCDMRNFTYEYDEEGNLIKECVYIDYELTEIILENVYEYDDNGNLIKDTYASGELYNFYHAITEYEYDDNDNLIKEVYYSDESKEALWEYQYDIKGNQIKAVCYDEDGVLISWCEYVYDEHNNQIQEIWKNEDGSISDWSESVYDEEGRLVEYELHIGEYVRWLNKTYDSYGNVIREEGSASSYYCSEYEYNENNKVIKSVSCNMDGTIESWCEYTYDSNNNLIKEVNYNASGVIGLWYEYLYDDNDNQIQTIMHKEDGSIIWGDELEFDEFGNEIYHKYSDYDYSYTIQYEYQYFGNIISFDSTEITNSSTSYPDLTGTDKWYRVRKSWEDKESQIGAFKEYKNAVTECGSGYAVYDDNGNELYRNE